MTAQLDIFGRRHPRPVRGKPAWQPSLIPPELERQADADDVRAILERFRDAGNRGEDEPPEVQS